MILIFMSWHNVSDILKSISQLTEAAFQVFLGKGILKICRKFKLHANLVQ